MVTPMTLMAMGKYPPPQCRKRAKVNWHRPGWKVSSFDDSAQMTASRRLPARWAQSIRDAFSRT